MKQAKQAAEKARSALLAKRGVIGVGHGLKRTKGQLTGIPCVVVYVEKKLPISTLSAGEAIPQQVEGVVTDVVEIRTVNALTTILIPAYSQRKRPCPGGYSIGHPLVTAGTMGLPVVLKDGQKALLSNTHVLAPVWLSGVKANDPIYQPGPYDGGKEADTIALLRNWAFISSSGPNQVDAALALIDEAKVDWRIEAVTPIYEKAGDPQPGDQVIKVGRTTGRTQGTIAVVGAAVNVSYGSFIALFTDQLEIVPLDSSKPFSSGGDSGSAILSSDGKGVLGLLFAGDDTVTYANPIALVQQALGFEIVPKPEPETIEKQLAGLAESLVIVWGYDARNQQWLMYDPLAPPELSTLKVLEKGRGYWFKVARDISFTYHCFTYGLVKDWNLVGWVG